MSLLVDSHPQSESDIERNRSKLCVLYHAATCPCEDIRYGNNVCTHEVHCCAAKRLFQHIVTCTQMDCDVPGCRHSRSVWKHYRKCRHPTSCGVCSAVPQTYTPKALCRRFRTVVKAYPNSGGDNFAGVGSDTNDGDGTLATTGSRGADDATTSNHTGMGAHVSRERIWQERIYYASVSASASHETASSTSVVVPQDNEKENNGADSAWIQANTSGKNANLFPFPATTGGQHPTTKSTERVTPMPKPYSEIRRGTVVVTTSTGSPERDAAKKGSAYPELAAHPRDAPRLHRLRRPNKNWSLI
jgi:hypothetical protein